MTMIRRRMCNFKDAITIEDLDTDDCSMDVSKLVGKGSKGPLETIS